MKTLLFSLLLAASSVAVASWDNPETPFSTARNQYKEVELKWVAVNDVQKTCESEFKKRKLGNLTYKVDACSFWEGNRCVMFTKMAPTMHDVGHEVRHCFQHNWH